MHWYGIDGCPGGWFYFRYDGSTWSSGIEARLADVLATAPADARLFIDIPIGLRDESPEPRGCDSAARRLLGRRSSSVFNAPIRAILGMDDYAAANARSRALSGKGLSRQSFFIAGKIHEVDRLLADDSSARERLVESHPELCFTGLNGGSPMRESKKRMAGYRERLALLESLHPGITGPVEEAVSRYRRRELARDDILDAAVLALVAAGVAEIRCLPADPALDSRGLPMRILYGCRDPG